MAAEWNGWMDRAAWRVIMADIARARIDFEEESQINSGSLLSSKEMMIVMKRIRYDTVWLADMSYYFCSLVSMLVLMDDAS